MSNLPLGFALGAASSIAINWSYFTQHESSSTGDELSIRAPVRLLRTLFTNRKWLTGFAVGIAGWIIYLLALSFAPISLVQASASGGIGVLAILTYRVQQTMITRREVLSVALAIVGLVLLAISMSSTLHHGRTTTWSEIGWTWMALVGLASVVVACRRFLGPGPALGLAAGCLYAAADVASKAAVEGSGLGFVPLILIGSIAGFAVQQLAFQQGSALITAGLSTLSGNLLPIIAGLTIFHDAVPGGGLGAVRIVAFVVVILGATGIAGARNKHEPRPATILG